MDFNYSSKINELRNLKEKNQIVRKLRESKERLLLEDPRAIVPFLREKFKQSYVRDLKLRSPRQRTPLVYPPQPKAALAPLNKDEDIFEIMSMQKNAFVGELQQLRVMAEQNNQNLKERLEQFIHNQDDKTAKSFEDMKNYFKLLNLSQMNNNQSYSNGKQSTIADLKNLRNQYINDGGTDPQILDDISELIQEAKSNQRGNPIVDFNWRETRRNLATALGKANELRELERYNAELEKQLSINRVRSENFNEKLNPWNDEKEKVQMEKIEMLQDQIRNLREEINNLKLSNTTDKTSRRESDLNQNLPLNEPRSTSTKMENFTIIFDYISGIEKDIISASVTLSTYYGFVEVMNPISFKPVALRQLKKTDLDSSILLNMNQPMKCLPSKDTFALFQLKVKRNPNEELRLEGWSRINLYDEGGILKEGNWKQIMYIPPIQTNSDEEELLQLHQYHRAMLHFRITTSLDNEAQNDVNEILISSNYSGSDTIRNRKPNPFLVNLEMRPIDDDSNDDKSDITIELDEKPEFGFQVIRVKNLVFGNGLELAKVRLTAYHTVGPKKGEIVMSSSGPVTCSTSAVRSDFKIACYQFGRQIGQFIDADLSVDCVVIARFYLENINVREQTSQMDEQLIAWTAIPLIKPRRIARKNPSYYTDSLKLLKINKGLHDLSLYEPPAASPLTIFFDRKGLIVGQKVFGRAKLKLRIFHTKPVYDSMTSSDEISNYENEINPKTWIAVDRTEPVLLPYYQDDGIDLYIDSGRLFPDSVTIVKIEGEIVNRNLISQGPKFSAITLPSSDVYNPVFNKRIEIREPHLSPSSTLLLKLLMFDRGDKNVVVLGFAAINLFLETGTNRQPSYDSLGVLISLNDGGHQLRIYSVGPDQTRFPFTESWFETNRIPRIPGASVLVRMFKAPKDPKGGILNIQNFPRDQYENLGLVVPIPNYDDAYYYSMRCKPTDGERQIMIEHLNRPKLLLGDLINSKWSDKLKESGLYAGIWDEINFLKLFDKFIPTSFNVNRIAQYVPTCGFKIAVDGCMNIPWAGYPMAHISLYPPGALYLRKPLIAFDRPFLISQLDLNSSPSAPVWKNGWKTYRKRKYDKNLIAILHVHEMSIATVENDLKFSLENEAWIPIQIFNGPYSITGATQMPLISGRPTLMNLEDLRNKTVKQFLIENLESKKISLLPNSSVIVRQCDSRRDIEVSLTAQKELLTLDQSYIPMASLSMYRRLYKPKKEVEFSKKIPLDLETNSFQDILKSKFENIIYKLYTDNGFNLQ